MARSLAAQFLNWDGFPFPFPEPWFMERWPAARLLRDRWESLCRDTAQNGSIDELHAARDDIQAIFDRHIALLKDYAALLDLSERITERNGPLRHVRDALSRETDELTRLYDAIFPNWKTADDLAEMLVEKFPLTSAQLDDLAKRSPPPQSWYDKEFDPFAPEAPE